MAWCELFEDQYMYVFSVPYFRPKSMNLIMSNNIDCQENINPGNDVNSSVLISSKLLN